MQEYTRKKKCEACTKKKDPSLEVKVAILGHFIAKGIKYFRPLKTN